MSIIEIEVNNSENISNIIHLSDIHIRTGNKINSRFDEYIEVFDNLITNLKDLETIKNKTVLIAILGDLFHNKSKIESHGIYLFNYLLKSLSTLAPVLLIQGNHDYIQSETEDIDLLDACLKNPINNVFYLNKTGHYKIGNIGFGLMSIKDVLQKGSSSGQNENLPLFPKPNIFPESISTKIALFHGTVINSKLDNYNYATNGVPFEWFEGYDITLLGDIHLQSIYKNKKHLEKINNINIKNVVAYSGSLIQQNFGESPFNKGFLLWDVKNFRVTTHDIKNPYKKLKIQLKDSEWILSYKRKYNLKSFLEKYNYCKIIKFRIIGNSTLEDLNNLKDLLKSYDINYIFESQLVNYIDNNQLNQDIIMNIEDIGTFNSKETWINFIEQKGLLNNSEINWRRFFDHPEDLKIDTKLCTDIEKINKKNTEIDIEINKFKKTFESIIIKNNINLNHVEFGYLLCFNKYNYFNFENLNNNIGLIKAENGFGKSAFLEIICLSLFGNAIPSRYNKTFSSSVISNQKPKNENAYSKLIFTISDQKYLLHRIYDVQSYDKNKLMIKTVLLYKINSIESLELIYSGTTSVNNWIKSNIGDINNFLLSSLITQNQDKDFFSQKSDEQLELLDNALKFESINALKNLLKTTINSYKYLLDILETMYNEYTNLPQYNENEILELNESILSYENQVKKLTLEYDNIDENWYEFNLIDFEIDNNIIQENITKLRQLYQALKFKGISYDNLLIEKGHIINELSKLPKLKNIENISLNDIQLNLKNLKEPLKPNQSLEIIIENNEKYKIWKEKWINFTYDENTHQEIKQEINIQNENIKNYFDKLSKIICPCNKPEKTLNDYNEWFKDYESMNIEFCKKYISIKKLEDLCNKNPLIKPSISKDQLEENKKELLNEIKNYINEEITDFNSLFDIDKYNKLLKTQEKLENNFKIVNNNIETLENYNDELKNELETIISKKNELVYLIEPNLQKEDCEKKLLNIKNIKETQSDLFNKISNIEEYNKFNSKYNKRLNELESILESITDSYNKTPYNPNCECCNQNPLRLQYINILNEKNETINILNTIKKPEDTDNYITLKNILNENEKELLKENEYKEILINWINYKEYLKLINDFSIEIGDIKEKITNNQNQKNLYYDKKNNYQLKITNNLVLINNMENIKNNIERWIRTKNFIDDQLDLWNKYYECSIIHDIFFKWNNIENLKVNWDSSMENIKQYKKFIDNRESLLNNISKSTIILNNNKALLDNYDQYTDENTKWNIVMEKNKNEIDKFEKYEEWSNKWEKYKYLELHNKIINIEEQLEIIKKMDELDKKINYWENLIKIKPHFLRKRELKIILQNNEENLKKIKEELIIKSKDIEILNENNRKKIVISDTMEYYKNKLNVLNLLSTSFIDYRLWLYKFKVIPKIIAYTNILIEDICDDNLIQLQGEINNNSISWYLIDGINTIEIQKASGFQRFILGIAVRIALSYIGASTVLCKTLFIDEGFTSCDNNHLEKVPDFLHKLLKLFNSILIVSHLDTIKESADICIPINRIQSISTIQFGEENKFIVPLKKQKLLKV
jgi:DNA repair exonuclease SbcCD ATPase subunit